MATVLDSTPMPALPRPFDDVFGEVEEGLTDAASRTYLRFHARRYRLLLAAVDEVIGARPPEEIRVLDVGPAYQTALLRAMWPGLVVDTLGFGDIRFAPRAGERHIHLDLNDAAGAGTGAETGPVGHHDLVVLAEVIEHLYTAAETVLGFLRPFLPVGGTLLLQTPNAVALPRRLKMLAGRNPAEPIRPDRFDPGHLHEYTVGELAAAAPVAGFRVERTELANYFANGGPIRRRYNDLIAPRLPGSLRDGITMVLTAV
jgi:hypothetical protein